MHSNVPSTYSTPVVDHAAPGPGPGPRTGSLARHESSAAPGSPEQSPSVAKHPSILRKRSSTAGRNRNESLGQMSKRVDFSLGMSSISSGADFGDVYEKPKIKVPRFREPSPSPERPSGEVDDASSLARTTSRDSASTDVGRSRSRKFFGMKGKARSKERDDLEAAVGRRRGESVISLQDVSKEHLAGIPEAEAEAISRRDSAEARMKDGARGRSGSGREMPGGEARIHPRTGVVNRQAVVSDDVDYEYAPQRRDSDDEARLVKEEMVRKSS